MSKMEITLHLLSVYDKMITFYDFFKSLYLFQVKVAFGFASVSHSNETLDSSIMLTFPGESAINKKKCMMNVKNQGFSMRSCWIYVFHTSGVQDIF